MLGIIASFVSCFWNFRYTRIGKRLNRFMSVLRSGAVPNKRVRKQDVSIAAAACAGRKS